MSPCVGKVFSGASFPSADALRLSIESAHFRAEAATRAAASFEKQEVAMRPSCRALPSLSSESRFLAERRLACCEELARLSPAIEHTLRGLDEAKVRLREEIVALQHHASDGPDPRDQLLAQKASLEQQVAVLHLQFNDLRCGEATMLARTEVTQAEAVLAGEVQSLCFERTATDAKVSRQQSRIKAGLANYRRRLSCNGIMLSNGTLSDARRNLQRRVELWVHLCQLRATRASESERCVALCNGQSFVARTNALKLRNRVQTAKHKIDALQEDTLKAEKCLVDSCRFIMFSHVSPMVASLLVVFCRLAMFVF